MYADAIDKLRRSFFPLIRETDLGNGQKNIAIVGTGFFVSEDGTFITADHVISVSPPNSKFLFGGHFPDHFLETPIQIEELVSLTDQDIFIGKVEIDDAVAVRVADERPRIGSSICLCGYPMPILRANATGGIDIQNVRRYFQPTYALDYMSGEVAGRNYDGFITQHNSLNGMSGGPVFDPDGIVYGMDALSWTREIPQPDGSKVVVQNGFAIRPEVIKQALEAI
jgi:S1-C subfamily serine protease